MTNPQGESLGRRMKRAREAKGLTLAQVAGQITTATGNPISERGIAKWEAGEVDVPASRVFQYATAVGVSAASLMRPERVVG